MIETLQKELTKELQMKILKNLQEKDIHTNDEFVNFKENILRPGQFEEILTKFLKSDIGMNYESMTDIKKLLLN